MCLILVPLYVVAMAVEAVSDVWGIKFFKRDDLRTGICNFFVRCYISEGNDQL